MKLQIELSKDNSVKTGDYTKLIKLTNAKQDTNLNFISAGFVSATVEGLNSKGKVVQVSKQTPQRNLTGLTTIIERSANYLMSENKRVKTLVVTVEY